MQRLLLCLLLLLPAWTTNAELPPITVEEVTPSRALPHAFYDQALASVPVAYPGSQIIEGTRFRQAGDLAYAFIAYRPGKHAQTLRLELLATADHRAWHLVADAAPAELEEQRQALLQHAAELAGAAAATCREHPLPQPATPLPETPPPAGPYERLSVYAADLDLGLGHLRPADEQLHNWDWYRRARFPLFAAPGGKPSGWIANGWLVAADGQRTPLGSAGMLETGYEIPSFLVLKKQDDWLQIRLAPPGAPGALAWVHPCHLAEGEPELVFEPWEVLFKRVETPLFFRRAIPHNLRAAPQPDAAIVHRIPAEEQRYQLDLLEVSGDWMRVRVTEPPSFCAEDDRPRATFEGWIKWRDHKVGPWVWYPTRGC